MKHRIAIARRGIVAGAILHCFLMSIAMTNAAKAADSIPQTVNDATALVNDSASQEKSGNDAAAEAKLQLVLQSQVFAQLPPKEQAAILETIGAFEHRLNHRREALEMFKRACETNAAQAHAWIKRLAVDKELEDADGVEALTALAQQAPQVLPHINPYTVIWAAEKSVQLSDDATIALIGALHAAHWQNPERYDATDTMWLYLARAYLDRGDTKDAVAVMADVNSVGALVAARAEKLFDPVVALDPGHFDIARAAEAEIAKYQKWAKEDPDRLAAAVDLTRALTLAQHNAEAIAVADAALAHLRSGDAPAFKDKAASLSQLMDARSEALFDAGRVQDALDQMSEGAHVLEYGNPNVDQVIDLADYYMLAGKPHDALDAVAVLDPKLATPYGLMAAANVRACAYAQLHETRKLSVEMNYMQAHEKDAPALLFDAYISTGDMNSAAAAAIAFMHDPLTRSRMLVDLQDYAGSEETPTRREYKRRYLELRNRPDVAAAISAIGHIDSYPIYEPSV